MSAIKTIPVIKSLIAQANNNISGEVFWEGEKGEKTILDSITDVVCNRGLMMFPNAAALSQAGGIDTGWALVKLDGANCLYRFYENTDSTSTGAINGQGGQWRLIISGDNNRKRYRVLVDTGDALSFGITHNLGYDFPAVRCIQSEVDLEVPRIPIAAQSITYTDENTLNIIFGAGDSNKLITIIIEI